MNRSSVFVLLVLLVCRFMTPVSAQIGSDPRAYYVVIGAFAIKKNAVNFTNSASKNYSATFEWNPNRSLDYVYILKTDDKQTAVTEAMRLRTTTVYDDTWVYYGVLGENADVSFQSRDINPVTEQRLTEVPLADVEGEGGSDSSGPATASVTAQNDPQDITEPDDPRARNYFFKVTRVDTKAVIEGEVNVIDTDKARKIGSYDANKKVKVSPPADPEGGISLICEVFGYRKVQRDISNFNDPQGEGIIRADGAAVVPFELMRLQKGDIATMFHVYFFKDAAVMRPESRYEANSLAEMMEENQKYKIRIHGHTNGNAAGKITSLNKGAENFFALNNTSDGYGSAKKLSQMRAELMRDFLVANGVEHKRIQIKAWGGKKPIYDKLHTQAQANVRVEIEILDN
jgi:outer membrane protein OmpA-like peptidoglycan-associated protein